MLVVIILLYFKVILLVKQSPDYVVTLNIPGSVLQKRQEHGKLF